MAERGRQPGFVMGPEHRLKIANSNVLRALIEHAEGTREMSSTQVTAGLGLLKKVMPDLSQMAVTNEEGGTLAVELIRRVIVDARPGNTDS